MMITDNKTVTVPFNIPPQILFVDKNLPEEEKKKVKSVFMKLFQNAPAIYNEIRPMLHRCHLVFEHNHRDDADAAYASCALIVILQNGTQTKPS